MEYLIIGNEPITNLCSVHISCGTQTVNVCGGSSCLHVAPAPTPPRPPVTCICHNHHYTKTSESYKF